MYICRIEYIYVESRHFTHLYSNNMIFMLYSYSNATNKTVMDINWLSLSKPEFICVGIDLTVFIYYNNCISLCERTVLL